MSEHERASARPPADALTSAIEAAKRSPADEQKWELVEELVDGAQRPSDVRELFKDVLQTSDLSAAVASQVGQRAVRFYETWYGDDASELAALLTRVLERDRHADWAFERLSVALTAAERWSDLLAAYDAALTSVDDPARRMKLLDDAAQLAKDFAAQPDRAIGYMTELYKLDPENGALANSLERLLERQNRWQDLITLWRGRLASQPARQQRDTHLRIASCCLDALHDPAGALREIEPVLQDAPDYKPALDVADRVLGADATGSSERRVALRYLREFFVRTVQPQEVVRVLETSLAFAPPADKCALLRELVERSVDMRDDARALEHQASLLVLEPLPHERDTLRALAERTRNFERFATALAQAADACPEPGMRVELLMEAGRLREENLGQLTAAIEFYQQVFNAGVSADSVVQAGRRLLRLLEQTERERETLAVLARLSELEPIDSLRKTLLGKLAQLAEKLGDPERARAAWSTRVAEDPGDLEALEALIASAAREQNYAGLAKLLRQRSQAPTAAHQRRSDLVWLASVHDEHLRDLDSAIATWREVREAFGEDEEAVSALTDLLSRAERWNELADVLSVAAQGEVQRFTELQTKLGDAYRARLGEPELAVLRYRSALQVDPTHAAARSGQRALLEHPLCRSIAVNSLAEAYASTGEWQNSLELLEARLEVASSLEARSSILIEAAQLCETRAQEPTRALDNYRRAFTYAADDRATEREIRRLAEQLGRWDAVVAAYRDTIASQARPTPRVAELRYDEGQTLETRLSDSASALEAYLEAARIAPEREEFVSAALRTAAQLGRWELVAHTLLSGCAARNAISDLHWRMLEQAAAAGSAWDALCNALEQALSQATELSPAVLRDLQRRVAGLQHEQRGDLAAAERALTRAHAHDVRHRDTLLELAAVQRTLRSPGLARSLQALAELAPDDLDALWEAAEIVVDPNQAQLILNALYERSVSLWRRERAASGLRTPQPSAAFAVERLSSLHRSAQQPERALDLLVDATRLHFEPAAIGALLHSAASLAESPLAALPRAMSLYREILTRDPRDSQAIGALASLYARTDRLPELLTLRRHELSLEPKPPRKLELRLEITRLLGEIEARGDRWSSLTQNLSEQPGHRATLDALNALLRENRKYLELGEQFEAQARLLTSQGHRGEAAWLWREVANLRERELSDPRSALLAYRELHDLEPAGDASAALARLYAGLGEHALAAEWLEVRLGSAPPDARAATAVALARAHIDAGQSSQARACLEQALVEHPQLEEARELLAKLYRQDGAHEQLAQVLAKGAELLHEPARRLAYLREAAELYCDKLGAPDRAVPVLQRAAELAPDDLHLRGMLAEGLHVAGRFDEARAVLKAIIEGFGRKRSPERAEFHYQMARVAASAGNPNEAFVELEQATKMDVGHQNALHMLASLAQQHGDLERAEKAYRSLLLLLRRHKSEGEAELGPAEVLFELYRIAQVRQQPTAAEELLSSALEAAGQSELEARRFTRVLRARGALDLLLRVLDARLQAAREPKLEAELLSTKADILEHEQNNPGGALELRLRAVALDEQSDALHTAAAALATRRNELPRYLELLGKLADDAQRTRTPAGIRSHARHTLRLGRAIEEQLADLDRAAALYAKVEASGECVVEAWLSLARIAGARQEYDEQRRILLRVSELEPSRVSHLERNEARFQLAELELREPNWREQGVETLQAALEASQDYARAKRVLSTALEQAPDHAALLAMCERVARASHDEPLLLMCIERRALLPNGNLGALREGIELALRRSDPARAERLLERARSLIQADRSQTDNSTWIFSGLAECRLQAKDTRGAMQYLREAIAFATESESQTLARELAELASGPDGDLDVAVETYTGLLEREPADRTLWEPMLHVLMRRADVKELAGFVKHTLSGLLMVEDRVFLQFTYANYLLGTKRDQDAAKVLRHLLEEDPSQLAATDLLLSIYQRHGMRDELAELLRHQFDRARDDRNATAIGELGLRLGSLYGTEHAEQACDVYRAALEWDRENRTLLEALLQLLPADGDARERAELRLRMLTTETGQRAAKLALELAAQFAELSDSDREREALELGYKNAPASETVRGRLEAFYVEREDFRPLAELTMREAERLGSSVAAVAQYKNAAAIYRDHLQDMEGAAAALRAALAIEPNDLSLLGELARNLAAVGQHAQAIADVTRLLDGHPAADSGRVDLLRVRADLSLAANDPAQAALDLEAAYAIGGAPLGSELLTALGLLRDWARSAGDEAQAQTASLRSVALLDALGDAEGARNELLALSQQSPDDIETLLALRDRAARANQFADVADSCKRLVDLTTGQARIDAALSLAEAEQRLGQPAAALPWLERVHQDAPAALPVRDRLRELYAAQGQQRELAVLLMGDAVYMTETADKLACWQRAAELFLAVGEPETATDPLRRASEVAPDDDRTRLLLIDIDLSLGRVDEAAVSVEQAMTAHKRRRSPELAMFQQRMARICALRGDSAGQLKWLNTALDTDRKSGEVASELVDAAMAIGDDDTAMKALRTLTMMEDPRPITRALAFLKQAQIAASKGDIQRAQHWARKAKSLDENLTEADDFLAQISG